jgi:hypothetical protein
MKKKFTLYTAPHQVIYHVVILYCSWYGPYRKHKFHMHITIKGEMDIPGMCCVKFPMHILYKSLENLAKEEEDIMKKSYRERVVINFSFVTDVLMKTTLKWVSFFK